MLSQFQVDNNVSSIIQQDTPSSLGRGGMRGFWCILSCFSFLQMICSHLPGCLLIVIFLIATLLPFSSMTRLPLQWTPFALMGSPSYKRSVPGCIVYLAFRIERRPFFTFCPWKTRSFLSDIRASLLFVRLHPIWDPFFLVPSRMSVYTAS